MRHFPDEKDIQKAHEFMKANNFGVIVAHAPYTYNLASAKEDVREFSMETLKDDLARLKIMELSYLVVHVGAHVGQGEEKGLSLVIEGLEEVLNHIPPGIKIVLEGMAGEGTELGYTFDHLAHIIKGCDNHPGLGICLDSCHMTGAGYDLSSFKEVKKEIKDLIGWERIKVFHLNDSVNPIGSKRDRHAKLGEGQLGLGVIKGIVCDPDLENIPFILETPNDEDGYAKEIALVKDLCR
jgi:deoxyribonuclease-4